MLQNMTDTQDAMLLEIMQYRFALLETALYLDTHPNDPDVLERHNYFSSQLDGLVRQYQKDYNDPLDLYQTAEGRWTYIDRWPWIAANGGCS
jgi:spore coat protein JB